MKTQIKYLGQFDEMLLMRNELIERNQAMNDDRLVKLLIDDFKKDAMEAQKSDKLEELEALSQLIRVKLDALRSRASDQSVEDLEASVKLLIRLNAKLD